MICLISLSVITLHWQTSIGQAEALSVPSDKTPQKLDCQCQLLGGIVACNGVLGADRTVALATSLAFWPVTRTYWRAVETAQPPSFSRRLASTATDAATRCALEKNSRWIRKSTVMRLAATATHSDANQNTIGTAK